MKTRSDLVKVLFVAQECVFTLIPPHEPITVFNQVNSNTQSSSWHQSSSLTSPKRDLQSIAIKLMAGTRLSSSLLVFPVYNTDLVSTNVVNRIRCTKKQEGK